MTLSNRYEPYGEVLSSVGNATSTYGYTGEIQEGSQVFLRSRYYDSVSGRFITRDTWPGDNNIPMSYNAWLYSYGNSINRTDPSGYVPCPSNTKCPGYGGDGKSGAEKFRPNGIKFTPENDPLWRGAIGIPHGVNNAQGVNVTKPEQWKSKKYKNYPQNPNLCGQVSVAAILASVDPWITVMEVLDDYEAMMGTSLTNKITLDQIYQTY